MARNLTVSEPPKVEYDFIRNSSFDGVPPTLQHGLFQVEGCNSTVSEPPIVEYDLISNSSFDGVPTTLQHVPFQVEGRILTVNEQLEYDFISNSSFDGVPATFQHGLFQVEGRNLTVSKLLEYDFISDSSFDGFPATLQHGLFQVEEHNLTVSEPPIVEYDLISNSSFDDVPTTLQHVLFQVEGRNLTVSELLEYDFISNSSFDGVPPTLQHGLFQVEAPFNLVPLEAEDDEVVIISPKSFAEARQNARGRRQVTDVIDDAPSHQRNNSGENGGRRVRMRVEGRGLDLDINERPEVATQPVPQTRTPVFNCPICLGPISQETSTKCGHIFCRGCINTALLEMKKCPTCRRKLKLTDTFRIYFPNSE